MKSAGPRRNFWDNMKASMGWWPYRCHACGRRFTKAQRYPTSEPPSQPRSREARPRPGPEMAFRGDPVRPMAKVVIEADDHVQLDRILLALHHAVSAYQSSPRSRATAETP